MTAGSTAPPEVEASGRGRLECAGPYAGPPPVVHPETEEHWRGLGSGRFLLQRCSQCATIRFPLAPLCWSCGAGEAEWVPVPTTGVVAVAVTVHRATGDQRWAASVPFVAAQVDLEGGRRLPGRVVDADPTHPPSRGTPVTAAYLDAGDGIGVLCFRLHTTDTTDTPDTPDLTQEPA